MIQFRVRYGELHQALRRAQRWRSLARAAWLSLWVPLAATALRAAGGPAAPPALVAGLSALVLGFAAWRAQRRRSLDVRSVDRRFGLDDLLVTAVEVDARGPRTALEGDLLAAAAAQVEAIPTDLRSEPARLRREAETVLAMALLAAGAQIVVDGWRRAPLPVAAVAPGDAVVAGAEGAGATGQAAAHRPADGALAAALADAPIAAPVAAALAAGDPWAAAQAVRALADQAESMSALGRSELAAALRDAQRRVAPDDPELAAAAARAADGLASATPPAGPNGLDALADALAARAARAAATAAPRAAPRAGVIATPPAGLPSGAPGGIGAGSAAGAAGAAGDVEPAAVTGDSAGAVAGGGGARGAVGASDREAVRRYFDRTAGAEADGR